MPSASPAQNDIVLDEVVVEGQGEPTQADATGPVRGYVPKATATGSKTATPIQEIPQAVSVLGREEIDDRGAQTADEALRYTGGVLAQPFGPDSDTNWVFIRGFQATQTGIYQDGLQLYSYSFGGFYIDSFLLERIEVLKGPASVLYGGSNPGGIVNFVSKRPTGETFRKLEVGVDTFGRGYGGFDVGGTAGKVDYRATGRVLAGEGYTEFSDQFLGTLSPSLTFQIDEATTLTVLANYTHLDKTHEGGSFLPYVGTVVDAPFGKIDREFNYTEPDIDDYDREQVSIGYAFAHDLNEDWTIRQNFRYGHADVSEVALYPFGYNDPAGFGFLPAPVPGDNSLDRINFGHDTTVDTVLLDNQIEGEFATGPLEHRLLAGVDFKYFNIDQIQESTSSSPFAVDPATPIDPTDPDYGEDQGTRVPYLDEDLTQKQLGVYAQDQIRFLDGWLVTLNGRYDQVWTESENRLLDGVVTEGEDGALSGRAGLAYAFDNGLTPYASAATFFNPVIGVTGFGGLYEPETGQQYEVGLKYLPTFFDGVFTLALFDLTRQNVLTPIPLDPLFRQEQTGEVRSRGIEVEGKADITDNIKAVASLTWLDLEVTEDNDPTIVGNQPTLIPDLTAAAFLQYTFNEGALEGFSVGGGVRYQGESFADAANTLVVPDAVLLDAKLGYRRGRWGVDLNVTNLLDEEYVASCQTVYVCSYGEARKALLKASVTW